MELGISYFFGFKNITPEVRMKMIKQAGFNYIITTDDIKYRKQNLSLRKQVYLAKKYNLKLSSLHAQYTNETLHYFWEEGKEGERLTKTLIGDVKKCHKYGFTCVVFHSFGTPSQVGVDRLNRVLDVCEKLKVILCIENIDDRKNFDFVVKKFEDNKFLKFCCDVGHNNVFDKNVDFLKTLSKKAFTLHLHDNKGTRDDHTLPGKGNIDWDSVAKDIANTDIEILDYELLMASGIDGYEPKEVLESCYKSAVELKEKIINYRNI